MTFFHCHPPKPITLSFTHSSPVYIRFNDIDAFGHVNNAVYLTYVEQARVHYFNEIVGWEWDWSKDGIILAKAEIDYLQPVTFRDDIRIRTRCARIGTKSMDIEYQIVKIHEGNEILMATANTVVVAYDYETKKTIPVPEAWKAAISRYEAPGSVMGV